MDAGGVSDCARTTNGGRARDSGSEPGFLIDTEMASHEAVLKTISKFTLAGDFKVSDVTSETALLTIQGQGAAEILENDFAQEVSELPENGVVENPGSTMIFVRITRVKRVWISSSTHRIKLRSSKVLKQQAHNQSVRTHSRSCAAKPVSRALDRTWMKPTSFPKPISTLR